MKPFRLPWIWVSDDEYIARLRRSIPLWDRWRPWFIVFGLGALGGIIWLVSESVQLLLQLVPPANAPFALQGFVTGALLGFMVGALIHRVVHFLVWMAFGQRAERLLLKYLDSQNSGHSESQEHAFDGSGFQDLHDRLRHW